MVILKFPQIMIFFRCPTDTTFKLIQKDINNLRFQIRVFDFLRKNKGIYMHCTSTLCKRDSTHPVCQFGCEHAPSDRKSRRRFNHKETISNEIYTVSSGFIEMEDNLSNHVEVVG